MTYAAFDASQLEEATQDATCQSTLGLCTTAPQIPTAVEGRVIYQQINAPGALTRQTAVMGTAKIQVQQQANVAHAEMWVRRARLRCLDQIPVRTPTTTKSIASQVCAVEFAKTTTMVDAVAMNGTGAITTTNALAPTAKILGQTMRGA